MKNMENCRINTAFCLLGNIFTKLPTLFCVINPQENNRTLNKYQNEKDFISRINWFRI